jgi:hypothetical protein
MRANCYNCGFKATYGGGDLGHGFEAWLGYLGVPREKIQEAKLEILSKKLSGELEVVEKQQWFRTDDFPEVDLPVGSKPLAHWASLEEPPAEFVSCLEYLALRGRAVSENWEYHWTPISSRKQPEFNNRIIIPFMHHGKVIGWSGRYCGKPPGRTPRYFNSDLPPGYLFNGDVISSRTRKFVLILEGPLDAISVDGVSPLGSTMNQSQISWLNSTDKTKIVVPDRESKNQELIDVALEQGWYVSFPEWEPRIKDAAAASERYGRIYTLHSILAARTGNQLEIGVKRQMLGG